MSNLSQDDLQYGTARRLIPDGVYSVGESGDFNLQPASSSSVMTMTNFAADEGGDDCEECEEALDNCLEDKGELVVLLQQCNTNLITCNTEVGKLETTIIVLTQQLCESNSAIQQLTGVSSIAGGYFEVKNATAEYQLGTNPPIPVTVSLIIYESSPGAYGIYYNSSSTDSSARWWLARPDLAVGGSDGIIFGPKDAGDSGQANFNLAANCEFPLELVAYSSFFQQPENRGSSSVDALVCPENFVNPCE